MFIRYPASSPWWNSREAARAGFGPRARREEEVDAGHLRRRATKLSGQILPADQRRRRRVSLIRDKETIWAAPVAKVAAVPGASFVATPVQCPALLRCCFALAAGRRSQRGPREFQHGLLAIAEQLLGSLILTGEQVRRHGHTCRGDAIPGAFRRCAKTVLALHHVRHGLEGIHAISEKGTRL
jgi:hypothetical protein